MNNIQRILSSVSLTSGVALASITISPSVSASTVCFEGSI